MKRWIAVLCAMMSLAVLVPVGSVSASGVFVTDYDYVQMLSGGIDDAIVYTAYQTDGSLVMGTMTAQGEKTREAYDAARFFAFFEPAPWDITIHGNAADLCPYASTHRTNTVCPYQQVNLVTMKHTVSDLILENYYIPSEAQAVLPEGSVHFCLGRYHYKAPLTLKWEDGERYMALKNAEGLWGVLDTQTGDMAAAYAYADMDTPYGTYVKVSDGNAWGRLDLEGVLPTKYHFATCEEFSVREEARAVEGGLRIFSKDNEILSPVIAGDFTSWVYHEAAHLLLVTAADGSRTFYDVTGQAVQTFAADKTVRHLQDSCYAVEWTDGQALLGTALLRMDDMAHPDDSVVKGDVNLDGAFNTSDVRLILLKAISDQPLTHRCTLAADMDGDGTVTTADAKQLLQQILM